uniref:Uncharacterized protein n=1 Tax=Cacopsylla melanoneura TaxID=428564 RepID=A0A8D8ZPW6_9HEMI
MSTLYMTFTFPPPYLCLPSYPFCVRFQCFKIFIVMVICTLHHYILFHVILNTSVAVWQCFVYLCDISRSRNYLCGPKLRKSKNSYYKNIIKANTNLINP